MKPNLKSARDAVTATIAVAIYGSLTEYGVLPITATVVAGALAFLIARGYRAARKRWAWLADFDPAAAPEPAPPTFP